jgi:hypothetical protein
MYGRMKDSTLFTDDLAGECRAAKQAWGLERRRDRELEPRSRRGPGAGGAGGAAGVPRTYLLIVNTPDECVIGGDANELSRLVATLGSRFFSRCTV